MGTSHCDTTASQYHRKLGAGSSAADLAEKHRSHGQWYWPLPAYAELTGSDDLVSAGVMAILIVSWSRISQSKISIRCLAQSSAKTGNVAVCIGCDLTLGNNALFCACADTRSGSSVITWALRFLLILINDTCKCGTFAASLQVLLLIPFPLVSLAIPTITSG